MNGSVGEIDERYRSNNAIVVHAACQAVVWGTRYVPASCLLTEHASADVIVLFIVLW